MGLQRKRLDFFVDVVVAVAVGIGSCGVQSLSSLFILLQVSLLLLTLINEHRFHQYISFASFNLLLSKFNK